MSVAKYDIDEYNRYIDDMDIIAKEAEENGILLRDYLLEQVGVKENTVDVLIKAWNPEYFQEHSINHQTQNNKQKAVSLFDNFLDRPLTLSHIIFFLLSPFVLIFVLVFLVIVDFVSIPLAITFFMLLLFTAIICLWLSLIMDDARSKIFQLGLILYAVFWFILSTTKSIEEGRVLWVIYAFGLWPLLLLCLHRKRINKNKNLTSQST